VSATYVYGLISADADLPEDLAGLGPSGSVSTVAHGKLAAIVSDVPLDRPLGTRDDLLAHERVVDSVVNHTTVLPMRFPAVIEEEGLVEELLGPHQEHFLAILDRLDGKVQYTLKARYEQDVLLQEILEEDEQIRRLHEQVRELPEDAAYYDRVKLGELIVRALEKRREVDAADIVERLEPFAADVSTTTPSQPEDVVIAAFLVERGAVPAFDEAVEDLGRDTHEWLRLRLLGPLAPYDFIPQE
jgi:hypothetical protein